MTVPVAEPPPATPSPSRRSYLARLRSPVAEVAAGGVLLLGFGFGSGHVVGHDHGGAAAGSVVPGGRPGTFGGGADFGGVRGQTQPGTAGFGVQSGSQSGPVGTNSVGTRGFSQAGGAAVLPQA